jgi:hypothetical protein
MGHASFWETIGALLIPAGIGIGMAWLGAGLCREARQNRGGLPTTATIDALDYTGNYLTGRFFATVSFRDAAARHHQARLGLAPYIWNRLRAGGTLAIVYDPAIPENVGLAGQALRNVAGIIFVTIGIGLVLLTLWMLIGGLMGWIEISGLHPHQGWMTPLPAPR